MARAGCLILSADGLALIERRRGPHHYYLIPGGAVEPGESPQQTAAREVKEETGLDVRVGPLVAVVYFDGNTQYVYVAEIIGGRYGSGTGSELALTSQDPLGTYTPVWLPLDKLDGAPVRPYQIVGLVGKGATDGWPTTPAEIHDDGPSPQAPTS